MAAGGIGVAAAEAEHIVPRSSGIAPPKLKPPPNACDCHMHVYDGRFPAVPNAKLLPPDASVDAHRLLQKRLGTTRTIVVNRPLMEPTIPARSTRLLSLAQVRAASQSSTRASPTPNSSG
jgi:hypothetical protein